MSLPTLMVFFGCFFTGADCGWLVSKVLLRATGGQVLLGMFIGGCLGAFLLWRGATKLAGKLLEREEFIQAKIILVAVMVLVPVLLFGISLKNLH
jgi:hypothetical protein